MAQSATDIQTIIDDIDTKITALRTSPEVDYSLGSKSVKSGQKIEQLMKQREYYQSLLVAIPAEDTKDMEDSTTDFGEDNNEYIGD